MSEAIRQGDIPGVQLRCRQRLGSSPDEAWAAVTEARALERWLCRRVEVAESHSEWHGAYDLEPGATEVVARLAVEAPRRLVATLRQPSWTAVTRLEIEVAGRPDGSEISVLQNGFEHLPLSQGLTVWEVYRRRWRAALERLAGC